MLRKTQAPGTRRGPLRFQIRRGVNRPLASGRLVRNTLPALATTPVPLEPGPAKHNSAARETDNSSFIVMPLGFTPFDFNCLTPRQPGYNRLGDVPHFR